jgi:hypothetical protein
VAVGLRAPPGPSYWPGAAEAGLLLPVRWAASTWTREVPIFLIFNFSILRKINTHIKNANLDAYTGG